MAIVDVQRLGKQLLQAVAFCHSKFVIHADIKPPNILISCNGEVRLADWDISCLVGCKCMMPPTHDVCSTGYKPPEILTLQPYDFAIDVWAVGRCICDMLCFEHGFHNFGSIQAQLDVVNKFAGPLPPEYLTKIKPMSQYMGLFNAFPFVPVQLQPLLKKMHIPNGTQRITAAAALLDAFFAHKF